MNEQEAELLVARLARIWEPGQVDSWCLTDSKFRLDFSFQGLCGAHLQGPNFFWVELQEKEEASLRWTLDRGKSELSWFSIEQGRRTHNESLVVRALVAQYLPLFRRNCWLSGCPLEATAHEKAEWMQGFTPEEIEAWNLKVS